VIVYGITIYLLNVVTTDLCITDSLASAFPPR